MHSVRRIQDNIYQVNEAGLSMQYFIFGRDKGLLFDTGTGTGGLKQLADSMSPAGYDVVITHVHNDHFGGAFEFEKLYVPQNDMYAVGQITRESREGYIRKMVSCGACDKKLLTLFPLQNVSDLEDRCSAINDGDEFAVGPFVFKAFAAPGHTEGEMVFYDERNNILISGDSANPVMVIKMKGNRMSAFQTWFRSLTLIRNIIDSRTLILAGHGLLDSSTVDSLYRLGSDYLEGKAKAEKRKVHLYTGYFLCREGIEIYLGSEEEMRLC